MKNSNESYFADTVNRLEQAKKGEVISIPLNFKTELRNRLLQKINSPLYDVDCGTNFLSFILKWRYVFASMPVFLIVGVLAFQSLNQRTHLPLIDQSSDFILSIDENNSDFSEEKNSNNNVTSSSNRHIRTFSPEGFLPDDEVLQKYLDSLNPVEFSDLSSVSIKQEKEITIQPESRNFQSDLISHSILDRYYVVTDPVYGTFDSYSKPSVTVKYSPVFEYVENEIPFEDKPVFADQKQITQFVEDISFSGNFESESAQLWLDQAIVSARNDSLQLSRDQFALVEANENDSDLSISNEKKYNQSGSFASLASFITDKNKIFSMPISLESLDELKIVYEGKEIQKIEKIIKQEFSNYVCKFKCHVKVEILQKGVLFMATLIDGDAKIITKFLSLGEEKSNVLTEIFY